MRRSPLRIIVTVPPMATDSIPRRWAKARAANRSCCSTRPATSSNSSSRPATTPRDDISALEPSPTPESGDRDRRESVLERVSFRRGGREVAVVEAVAEAVAQEPQPASVSV